MSAVNVVVLVLLLIVAKWAALLWLERAHAALLAEVEELKVLLDRVPEPEMAAAAVASSL